MKRVKQQKVLKITEQIIHRNKDESAQAANRCWFFALEDVWFGSQGLSVSYIINTYSELFLDSI